jgi:hypothetical protein
MEAKEKKKKVKKLTEKELIAKKHREIRSLVKEECLNDDGFQEYKNKLIGRPTKYADWMDDFVVYFLSDGKSIVELAATLKVTVSTIYEWKNKNPSFSEAISLGMTLCQSWWEKESRISLRDKDFNTGLWVQNVKSRFKNDWGDSKKDNDNENDFFAAMASFVLNNNNGIVKNGRTEKKSDN